MNIAKRNVAMTIILICLIAGLGVDARTRTRTGASTGVGKTSTVKRKTVVKKLGPGKPTLFIGNSYTGSAIPEILKRMAIGVPRITHVDYALAVKGAYSLATHVQDKDHMTLLRSKAKWDYVVIQDQSMMPLDKEYHPEMLEAAGKLATEAKRRKAKVIVFMTWARVRMPEQTRKLQAIYVKVADSVGGTVAPVGLAFAEATKAKHKVYAEDGAHPNLLGKYLASCVLYATIYRRSPTQTNSKLVSNLKESDCVAMQKLAWKVCVKYRKARAASRKSKAK